jgi:putative holliday junction resolvase
MILSLDYGKKRIGMALSDETELIAQAISMLPNKGDEKAIEKLKELLAKNPIRLILFGIPYGLDGKPTQMSKEIEKFAKLVNAELKIEYKLWNETLTSKSALTNLRSSKKQKSKNKMLIDSESARIILQEYLDQERQK